MLSTKQHKASQRGNALFLILVAVVLFAALSYAVTRSNVGESDPGSDVRNMTVSAMLNYTTALQTGVMRMKVRGVAAADFDTTKPDGAGFNTPPFSNKLFHPDGGGVPTPVSDPNAIELDINGVPKAVWMVLVFDDSGVPTGFIGTEGGLAVIGYVRKNICEEINYRIMGSRTIPQMPTSPLQFYYDSVAAGTPQTTYCATTSNLPDNRRFINIF